MRRFLLYLGLLFVLSGALPAWAGAQQPPGAFAPAGPDRPSDVAARVSWSLRHPVLEVGGRSATAARSQVQRKPRVRKAALLGLGFGAFIGGVYAAETCSRASEHPDCERASLLVGVPLFAAAGAGVGALIGSYLDRHDRRYPASPAVQRSGPVTGLGVDDARHVPRPRR